jgi:hypothetical protein
VALEQVLDLDADHTAANDRRFRLVAPSPAAVKARVQVVPDLNGHRPVAGIEQLEVLGRSRQALRIGEAQCPAVASRSPALSAASRRIGVKDALGTDAAAHLDALVTKVVADADRVIAGVEDEQRHLAVGRLECQQTPHLDDRGGRGIDVARDALEIDRHDPRVRARQQADDELIGPAGHDRLAGSAWRPSSGTPARGCTQRRHGPRSRRRRRR